jgi:hypothetical protein
MSGWNNTAMADAANALRTKYVYGQLHSAAAGGSGTSNVTSAARQSVTWTTPTGAGSFGLAAPISFTGGAASGAVYSITFWSASSGGTFGGEFILTGDTNFNAGGSYNVTANDLTGTST